METFFICLIIAIAILIFIWYHLNRTNIDIPPEAERVVEGAETWEETIQTQIVYNVNPDKGEPLPPAGFGHNGGPIWDPEKE